MQIREMAVLHKLSQKVKHSMFVFSDLPLEDDL